MGKKEDALTQVPAEARPVDLKTLPLSPGGRSEGTRYKKPQQDCFFLPVAGPKTVARRPAFVSGYLNPLDCKCCRKQDPFQGPKLGSCLTLGNELSKETHVPTKQEILLGKGTWVESRRVREPRRTALPHGLQSQVLW